MLLLKKSRFPVRVIEFWHSKKIGHLTRLDKKFLVLESIIDLSNVSSSEQSTNKSEKQKEGI